MKAPSSPHTGLALAVGSMISIQLGLGFAVVVLDRMGPTELAVLRLGVAGLLLMLLVRPRRAQFTRVSAGMTVLLGFVTAGITLLFMIAVSRIPLGTASALEFLGPLGVAVATARTRRDRVLWPALAAAGVILLTRPWEGTADWVGVAAALGAAGCWAGYIVLTRRVGESVPGFSGLAVSLAVAAVMATFVVGPTTWMTFSLSDLAIGAALAVLLPLVPFCLEMLALRRLSTSVFGTLMCFEPGLALVVGLVLLGQVPSAWAVVGLGLVVCAGVGVQRSAASTPQSDEQMRVPVA